MKGKPEVQEILAKMLKEELGAISQYIVHSEMCENWGYSRLGKHVKQQAVEEMKHAEVLIERILYLEGTPNLNDLPKLNIGKDVKQQLQNDLALEENAVAEYNDAVAAAQKASDHGSAELLKKLLLDEEGHLDFLETQLGIIKDIGLENYLIEQAEE
jgi:bacterioferritin